MSIRIHTMSLSLLCCCLVSSSGQAQGVTTSADSLTSYVLDEIVVSDVPQRERVPNTLQRVPLAGIARSDASSVDEIVRLIPSARAQINSRGESHVYLRGAGERQVAIFFDGALLNIPWDNRFDLSLVPASIVGEIEVAKGAVSVLQGPNGVGGSINLKPRDVPHSRRITEFEAMGGSAAFLQGRLTQLSRVRSWDYVIGAGYSGRDGFTIPGSHNLAFSQLRTDRRTNTDRVLTDVFARLTRRLGSGRQVGLTLMHVDAKQGVAPEGHLDPSLSRVRFWRYPDRQNSMAILGGHVPLSSRVGELRGVIWLGRSTQVTQQYESAEYASLLDRQDDEDRTGGIRLMFDQALRNGTLRLAMNALTSSHKRTGFVRDSSGNLRGDGSDLTFGQRIWSLGAEYDWQPRDQLRLLLGASIDGNATPSTGDKPSRDPDTDFSVTTGLRYSVDQHSALRISAGRKTRFPTMRELFGEALGRFLLNPDLSAESSVTVEAGFEVRAESFSGESILFFERSYDTIDQRSVLFPGEDRARRQRINREGGRSAGVEVVGQGRLGGGLTLGGHLTWLKSRTYDDGESNPAIEKPEWIGAGTLLYNARTGFSLLVQWLYTGRAYGLDDGNVLAPLATSLVINARGGFRLTSKRVVTEVFGRVDNITDALTLPQLGLPGPGRTFRFGVEVSVLSRNRNR